MQADLLVLFTEIVAPLCNFLSDYRMQKLGCATSMPRGVGDQSLKNTLQSDFENGYKDGRDSGNVATVMDASQYLYNYVLLECFSVSRSAL